MSVAGVHRLTLSLFPISFSASHANLSILANRKRTQFTLSHHFSLVHHSHGLSLNQNASSKSYAKAEPYNEGEMLDKNETNSKNKNPFVSEELLKKLKRYGVSGILSYGILNTVYYTTAFLLVWFYVAPAPGNMGFLAAAERAVALAPIVDRGLSWFTVKFKFGSQGKAFGAIVGICLGLALMMFVVVTLLSA